MIKKFNLPIIANFCTNIYGAMWGHECVIKLQWNIFEPYFDLALKLKIQR